MKFIKIILPWKRLSKKTRQRILLCSIAVILILAPIVAYSLTHLQKSEAAWFNTDWSFRKAINITAHTSAETNVYLNLTGGNALNTSDTTRFKTNCGDLRFTDINGKVLPYFIVSGCGTSTTVIHVFMQNFPAGAQTVYYYYGNPSAPNGFSTSDFAQAASGVTIGSLGAEENGAAPVLYFKFDEGQGTVANDSSSNSTDGTLINSPKWQTENQCISGKCLYFDGSSNSYVDAGNNLNFATTDSFTVSTWFKTTSLASQGTIINKGQNAVCFNYAFFVNTNGSITFGNTSGESTIIPAGTISANTWYHFEAVYVSGSITGYLNGIAYTTASSTTSTCTNSIKVGSAGVSGSRIFNGFIDEVKIYKYARTISQIKTDYSSRGSVKGVSTSIGASTANKNLSNGLVGYWNMDENSGAGSTLADSSGNGNTGIAALWGGGNTSTDSAHVVGKFGNSFNFDGVDDRIIVGNSSSLNITGPITISAWIKPTVVNIGQEIINKKADSDYSGYRLRLDWSNLAFSWSDGTNQLNVESSGGVSAGVWQHVIATYDQNIVRLYVNGNLIFSSNHSEPITSNLNTLKIGNYSGSFSAYPFWGGIDEARVYNRALSPAEVQQLYNYAPGPVAYYNFDEGQGSTVNDVSGNGYQATWNGSGTTQWTQGKYGKAGNFNGIDDYVQQTNNVDVHSQITLSAWIKPKSISNSPDIVGLSGYGPTWGYTLNIDSSGTLGLTYQDSGSTWHYTTRSSSIINNNNLNQWHYVTATHDGTTTNYYFDGVPVGSVSDTYSAGKSNNSIKIGLVGWFPFNGGIDDVKIYNYIRTSKQIVSDMNAGHPAGGSPVGSQVGYWKFDEGYANTTNDSSPQGNNLTITNATWTNDGKFNKALNFTSGASVSENSTNSLNFGTNDFSVSFWAYHRDYTNPKSLVSMHKGDQAYTAGHPGWEFGNSYNSTGYLFAINDGTHLVQSYIPMDPGFRPADVQNKWAYFVFVVSRTNGKVSLYVNGVKQSTDLDISSVTGSINNALEFRIGNINGWMIDGLVDEVKMYNYALTSAEIKLDMNHGASQVLGAMSNTSGLAGGTVASNSASAAYCIPGDTSTCSSPVGEWNFEEKKGTTTNDTSGNGNTGTISGATWTQGKYGAALNFNGLDPDSVSLGNPAVLNFGSNSFTYSLWVYVPKSVGPYDMAWYKGGSSAGDPGYDMELGTGAWAADIADGAGTKQISLGNETLNQWVQLTVVIDRANHQFISYSNGAKIDWTDITGFGSTSGTGALISRPAYPFNGKVDQVRVYNYARTPAQVAYDYNRGIPVGWWKFDECQGTTAHDSSGNGNNGTINIGASGSQTAAGTCTTAGTAWGNGATGKYNSSLNFDGADDFISANDNNPLNGGLTISTWYKTSSTVAYNTMFNRGDQGNVNGFVWFFFDNGTKDRLWYQEGNASYCSLESNAGTWSADGKWHNLVASHNPITNYITFYKDGIVIGGGSCTWANITNSSEYIGTYSNSSSNNYTITGQLDDFRLYNYPMTTSQIKQLYNQGAGVRFGPLTGNP